MKVLRTKSIEQSMKDADDPEYQLKRRLTAVDLTVFGIGVIIGAGIFTLTGAAAHDYAGPAVAISFAIAAICCAFAAICYAEMASAVPVSGSTYSYAYTTLGEFVAMGVAACLLLEYGVSTAAVAVGAVVLASLVIGAAPAPADLGSGQGAADYAASKVGCPYAFGAAGPTRFDNPGLVKAAYASVGVDLPQNTASLYALTRRINLADLMLGDLVFYGYPAYHMGIYAGGGMFYDAGRSGGTVKHRPVWAADVVYARVLA